MSRRWDESLMTLENELAQKPSALSLIYYPVSSPVIESIYHWALQQAILDSANSCVKSLSRRIEPSVN